MLSHKKKIMFIEFSINCYILFPSWWYMNVYMMWSCVLRHSFLSSDNSEDVSFIMLNSLSSCVSQNAPPCPTLFVANLGPTCTEQELIQIFSRLKQLIICYVFLVWNFKTLNVILCCMLLLLDAQDSWNWRCKIHTGLLWHLLIFRYSVIENCF